MTRSMEPISRSLHQGPVTSVDKYTGEVVYIYAFDVAYEMVRKPIRELLGQPVAQFSVDATKRSPRQLFFYRPQMVRLPPLQRIGPFRPVLLEPTVKILPVGAISITIRVPFSAPPSRKRANRPTDTPATTTTTSPSWTGTPPSPSTSPATSTKCSTAWNSPTSSAPSSRPTTACSTRTSNAPTATSTSVA